MHDMYNSWIGKEYIPMHTIDKLIHLITYKNNIIIKCKLKGTTDLY